MSSLVGQIFEIYLQMSSLVGQLDWKSTLNGQLDGMVS